jgi:heat shock protein HslJ
MKKTLFVVAVLLTALSSCKKDLATQWIGTYNGTAGTNTFNQIVISKVDDTTIKMEFKTMVLGTPYTYATVAHGTVTSNNAVAVSEDGTINGQTGTWHFSGGGSLSGNTLTVNGSATQTGQSTLYYTFVGSK